MKAKEFVKTHYPTAASERQTTNGGRHYWLIRERGKYMYMAEGETESKAWINAKNKIMHEIKTAQ